MVLAEGLDSVVSGGDHHHENESLLIVQEWKTKAQFPDSATSA